MGSQRALGEAVGLSQAAVGNWVMRGSKVPPEYCAAIEVATGRAVTRQDMRPDDWQKIWPELAPVPPASGPIPPVIASAPAATAPMAGAASATQGAANA